MSHTQVNKEIVHYIAPPADDIADKLEGLQVFMEKTEGQSALMRGGSSFCIFIRWRMAMAVYIAF